MSSIVLPVGQCGNQIGHELMTLIDSHSASHPLSHRDGKLRCVCVDSEPKVIGSNFRSDRRHSQLYRDANMIVGRCGRGNNFALGYHGLGGETEDNSLLHLTMEALRKEVERCDCYAGTIVMHSLTGGTGSGLGSRLVETIRDAYPLAHVMSVAVSPHLSGDSPLQHYNSLLSLAALQRSADIIVLFSNDDVLRHLIAYKGLTERHKPTSVSLNDMNQYIAASLAGAFQPLGDKPKKIIGKSSKGKRKSVSTDKSTSSERSFSGNDSRLKRKGKQVLGLNSSERSIWSASSRLSDMFSVEEDDTSSMMQQQPRATASALMRYRGITTPKITTATGGSHTQLSPMAGMQAADVAVDVPKGNEPWEMLRSICPEPSKKFATIHHMEKAKVSWEGLTQSLLHSMCRYDSDGKQFSTLTSLLIARGDTEKTFADSAARIEEKLKSSLGCVEWNPFAVDFWISQYGTAGSTNAQSLTLCVNSSRIIEMLHDVTTKARTMYNAGAYLHWFEKHGCTKDDFRDAFTTLECVVEEYRCATL